jgi:hypothetical protein
VDVTKKKKEKERKEKKRKKRIVKMDVLFVFCL